MEQTISPLRRFSALLNLRANALECPRLGHTSGTIAL
jgi:hypothetical protein